MNELKLLDLIEEAKMGDSESQYLVGGYYLFEKKDFLTGCYWLKLSYENGFEKASKVLAAVYNEGYLVKTNEKLARHWYLKSRLSFYKTEYNKAFGEKFDRYLVNKTK